MTSLLSIFTNQKCFKLEIKGEKWSDKYHIAIDTHGMCTISRGKKN